MRAFAILILLCGSGATVGAIAAEPAEREELVVTAPSRPPPLSLDAVGTVERVEITIAADELKIAPPSVKPPRPAPAPAALEQSADKKPLAAAEPGAQG